MGGYVYILASIYRGALYTGVSAELSRRVWEHREGLGSEYARRRGITRLVWSEPHADIGDAIAREKVIKRWPRAWKFALIEEDNPDWRDLWDELNA